MNFKNFDACLAAQKKKGKSDESARKICGALQKKAEGNFTQEEYNKILTQIWIEDVLNHDQS